jgi:hypothetical protein
MAYAEPRWPLNGIHPCIICLETFETSRRLRYVIAMSHYTESDHPTENTRKHTTSLIRVPAVPGNSLSAEIIRDTKIRTLLGDLSLALPATSSAVGRIACSGIQGLCIRKQY